MSWLDNITPAEWNEVSRKHREGLLNEQVKAKSRVPNTGSGSSDAGTPTDTSNMPSKDRSRSARKDR